MVAFVAAVAPAVGTAAATVVAVLSATVEVMAIPVCRRFYHSRLLVRRDDRLIPGFSGGLALLTKLVL